MGGAATGQPIDIAGALQWNPATITAFDENILRFDLGLFFTSSELSSTVPEFDSMGQPTGAFFSGTTRDDHPATLLPNIAYIWSKGDSKHSFGISTFGIGGFGVTFPESTDNPITLPQEMGGFGRIESNYMLLQFGFTWAYELSDNFSIAIQPNFDWSSLELMPNATASPNLSGYPSTGSASAVGIGAQVGIYYNSGKSFKAGMAYKSTQYFEKFEFENTYLDNSNNTNEFKLDYPSIFSIGIGYSKSDFDFALDYRHVKYENTEGFEKAGYTTFGTVKGFGWKNIDIVSIGIQCKGIKGVPLRLGYSYNSNPLTEELAFFRFAATAVIKNTFQFGLSMNASDQLRLDTAIFYATSSSETRGPFLNPTLVESFPPYGAVPGTEVSYSFDAAMVMVGLNYSFSGKENK